MSKVSGPLLSLDARGQIGNAMVFSGWKGIPYARKYVIPANPKSTKQVQVRGTFTFLHEVYKQSPQLFRNPWEALAKGKPLTSWNYFTKKNLSPIYTAADLTAFVFEEGANGGLPPDTITSTPGAGQITIATTNPATPVGWTLAGMVGLALRDMDPHGDVVEPMQAAEDTVTFDSVTITGLTTGQLYRTGAFLEWTKPDGTAAYGVSLQDSATPT